MLLKYFCGYDKNIFVLKNMLMKDLNSAYFNQFSSKQESKICVFDLITFQNIR